MPNSNHIQLLDEGKDRFNSYRVANPTEVIDFREAELVDRDFSGFNLTNVDFTDARLARSSLSNVDISRSRFVKCSLEGTSFQKARAEETLFSQVSFHSVNLAGIRAKKARFLNVDFSGGGLPNANLEEAVIENCRLNDCNLYYCRLRNATISTCDFTRANLTLADLCGATITRSTFHQSKLEGALVKRATISRIAIEDLRAENWCGLLPSQLYDLTILDEFGNLRAYFSGFWAFVHLLSIVAWLSPMLWIVLRSLALEVLPNPVESRIDHLSLIRQLSGYVLSGASAPTRIGTDLNYSTNVLFLSSWFLVFLYNCCRFTFIAKVKLLEHQQAITGLHPDVTLSPPWSMSFRAVKVLFWVNLIIVAAHVFHFLTTAYPVIVR